MEQGIAIAFQGQTNTVPLVSIIIPTHNRAAMLRRAIDSALLAGTDVEVVVVDDASTDGTQAMCRGLSGIRYVRTDRNVGLAGARNLGISASLGEFIAFLDDDDLRIAGSLDKQAPLLADDRGLGFVYGQALVGDPVNCIPTGEIRPSHCRTGDLFWEFLKGNFIYVPTVVVRRRALAEVGLFDTRLRATEDWDAWIRLAEKYPVGAVDEPVAVYRDFTRQSLSMSSNRPRMCRAGAATLAKALTLPRVRAAGPDVVRKLWAEHLNAAWDHLIREGDAALAERAYWYAIRNYATAISLNPRRLFGSVLRRIW